MRKSIRPSSMIPTSDNGARQMKPADFSMQLTKLAESTTTQLGEVWTLAGYEDVECQGILGEIFTKVSALLDLELTAEKKILDHANVQLEAQCREYRDIAALLGRDVGESVVPEELNYSDKLSRLETLLGSITVELNDRKAAFDAEIREVNQLSQVLDLDLLPDASAEVELSDQRLKQLRDLKIDLVSRRSQRLDALKAISRTCYEVMKDLVQPTDNAALKDRELERAIVQHNESSVWTLDVRAGLLKAMQTAQDTLQAERERRREELAMTGAEIARLWTLLRIPTAEREAFQTSFEMNLSLETLNKGYAELARLRIVRSQCLHRVVQSIRADILALWEELGVRSEEQRSKDFPAYFDALGSLEDMSVEQHENYFLSLKAHAEELRPLLQRGARREAIVAERLELEALQMNPERLAARGPNAREDRKREEGMNNRVKGLEKMTKELVAAVHAWESVNGPLFFDGERFLDRIRRQEEEYIDTRDTLRSARRKKSEGPATMSFQSRPDASSQGQNAPASASKSLPQAGRKTSALFVKPPPAPSAARGPAAGGTGVLELGGGALGLGDWENSSIEANLNLGGLRDSESTCATEVRDRESGFTVVREE